MEKNGTMIITIFDGEEEPRQIALDTFGKSRVTFGRASDNDIVLHSQVVSKTHGYFDINGDYCSLYDSGSTNGIFVENNKVNAANLVVGNIIRIMSGDPSLPTVSIIFGQEGKSTSWKNVDISGINELTIGREQNCNITLTNSNISKIHIIMKRYNDGWHLYDNNSTIGTIVNGKKVDKEIILREKDVILVANTKIVFSNQIISYIVYDSGMRVEAKDVVKTVKTAKGKLNIVNHVNLAIKPGEFVAIIGGSGAGKTSFLNCISGYSKPTQGEVLINGDDLYENYETMKYLIGYVPQADIVYDNLTVWSMLEYAAKLRMPADTSKKERREKVAQVISMVELNGREKFLIKSLSGGQKKRVSIAVELLSDPNLFFLDEPSSGLDPGTEEKLMETLSKMSKTGKTIILITHNTMNIHLCDKIIFLGKGGNLCYFGEPDKAKEFFGVENMVNVYNMVTDNAEEWKQKFYRYSGQNYSEDDKNTSLKNTNQKIVKKGSVLRQTRILTGRYFELMFRDIKRLMMLLLQAPLLGYLLYLVADDNVFTEYEITKAILFAMSCCAFWIGILNSIQEVCKERTILKREYLSGLSITAYILSKFIVLGIFCIVQSGLLMGTFALLVGLPDEGVFMSAGAEFFITTFLTAFSATAMGLFVSSLFKNADRAMTVAPILLMPQILFSGLAFTLSGVTEKISYMVTCRWSMEGYGSTSHLNDLVLNLQQNEELKDLIVHVSEDFYTDTALHILFSWEILLGFAIIFGVMSYIVLVNMKKSN